MDIRARFLVLAMVSAFGLAFALPVSAGHVSGGLGHGLTGPPPGCKNSQPMVANPNCYPLTLTTVSERGGSKKK